MLQSALKGHCYLSLRDYQEVGTHKFSTLTWPIRAIILEQEPYVGSETLAMAQEGVSQ